MNDSHHSKKAHEKNTESGETEQVLKAVLLGDSCQVMDFLAARSLPDTGCQDGTKLVIKNRYDYVPSFWFNFCLLSGLACGNSSC